MTDNVSELAGAFNSFKETFEKKQKDADVLITATQTKTADFIATAMQKQQDAETKANALEQEVKALSAALNRNNGGSASEADEAKTELNLHVKSFFKDGGHQTFQDYMKGAKIEAKALREGVDTDGGYLVRADVGTLLNTRIFETSPLRTIATVISLNSNRFEFPVDDDELAAATTTEEGARAVQNTPTIGMRIIEAHEIYGLYNVTKTMLQDMPSVDSWIANKIADKISRKENTSFVTGGGIATARGFLDYSAWAAAGTYESGKLEQVNSGTSAVFTYAGLSKLQGSLKEAYQRNAKFVFKRSAFANGVMQVVDGQSRPIFNMDFKSNTLAVGTILGAPVTFFDDMPVIAADALAGAYGDFGAGYIIVDRLGLDLLRDPYSNKPYVQFYATKRTGGDVANFEAIKIQKLAA